MTSREIDGKTNVIGLIGNPVEHTLSPVIHNGISKRLNINSAYLPFKVEENDVESAVKGAYSLNIKGLNVTVPHKNAVMPYLSEIDETAKMIGAVNTLVRTDNGFKGYNTDMPGLLRQVKEEGINLKGRKIVILGAGGAAKAVACMCVMEDAEKVYILNRTVEKAEDIAKTMNVIPMDIKDIDSLDDDNYIVFQCTSLGLYPNVDNVVVEDCSFYDKIDVAIDLIYNPAETKFMSLVKKHGGRAYNALKMLLYQGVIAYEYWHDIKVDEDIIKEVYVDLKREIYKKDNIVLIGFMGSGKTTFGKELAKRRGMDFIDTDDYIVEKCGMSIPEIFKEKGEEGFREIETNVLCELRDNLTNTVLATGGGMPLRYENALILKEIGKVYYLSSAPDIIYERVKGDNNRPLLKCDNPKEKIISMMKERKLLYEKACDECVDTNIVDFEYVLSQI